MPLLEKTMNSYLKWLNRMMAEFGMNFFLQYLSHPRDGIQVMGVIFHKPIVREFLILLPVSFYLHVYDND